MRGKSRVSIFASVQKFEDNSARIVYTSNATGVELVVGCYLMIVTKKKSHVRVASVFVMVFVVVLVVVLVVAVMVYWILW